MITNRSSKGTFTLLTAVTACFILLPMMMFTFEVGRITLAQKELHAATDTAALAAAVAISKNAGKTTAELTDIGRNQGLIYMRRNFIYDQTLRNVNLGSGQTNNLGLHQGTINITYDPVNNIVTAQSEFCMDLAFGNLLDLGPTTIRSISKATTSGTSQSDIVVLFDYSQSMGSALIPARDEAATFVGKIPAGVHVGLIYFALNPETSIGLSKTQDNRDAVKNRLKSLTQMKSGTNTGDALLAAKNMLDGSGHSSGSKKIVVMITDGLARKPSNLTKGTAHALNIADQCKDSNITLYGIGFFHPNAGATAADGKNFMDKLQKKFGGDSEVYTVTNVTDLHNALDQLTHKGTGTPALIN
ncbi:MAG: VWA domain-containing protein [Candidatus Obscuribacterales bacterium]|nr:VWA domain-containing protein [Candidatus Obscuribacterales bacterium]